jgi:hypothetical protein
MRALKGGVPRLTGDHRKPEFYTYRAYAVATIARFWPDGRLPASARPLLKEAGRIILELDRLATDFEKARTANRHKDVNRIRRQQQGQRHALLRLEDAMQAQAGPSGTFADAHKRLAVVSR